MNKGQKPRYRIFILDDEPHLAKVLSFILEREGIDSVSFRSPLNLLDFAADNVPDLVISDIKMPEMTGIELARNITTRYPHCKVLLFSGEVGTVESDTWAQDENSTFCVMSKPLSTRMLMRQIRQHVTTAGSSAE